MIEIIKQGSIKYQASCKECGCLFSFQAEDITRETVWDDHGGHYPVCDFYKINCPTCGHSIDLSYREDIKKEKDKMKHVDN